VYEAYGEAKEHLDKVKRTCPIRDRKVFKIPQVAGDDDLNIK
jgi:hypothetical protein